MIRRYISIRDIFKRIYKNSVLVNKIKIIKILIVLF